MKKQVASKKYLKLSGMILGMLVLSGAIVSNYMVRSNWKIFEQIPKKSVHLIASLRVARQIVDSERIPFDSFSGACTITLPYLSSSEYTSTVNVIDATPVMIVRSTMDGMVKGRSKGFMTVIYFHTLPNGTDPFAVLGKDKHELVQQTFIKSHQFAAPSFNGRSLSLIDNQQESTSLNGRTFYHVWKANPKLMEKFMSGIPLASPTPITQIDLFSGGEWTGSICLYGSQSESTQSSLTFCDSVSTGERVF